MSNPRLADLLLSVPAIPLGSLGYQTDPTLVERIGTKIRFYHDTHPEHLPAILAPDGGLRPRRTTPHPPTPDSPYVLEGLFSLSPPWMTGAPYFGDVGMELFQQHVGTIPLVVTVPQDFPGLRAFDYALAMECKSLASRGNAPLSLGFDCSNGRECVLAMARSCTSLAEYRGGHIAPIIERFGATTGIAIPSRSITVAQDETAN